MHPTTIGAKLFTCFTCNHELSLNFALAHTVKAYVDNHFRDWPPVLTERTFNTQLVQHWMPLRLSQLWLTLCYRGWIKDHLVRTRDALLDWFDKVCFEQVLVYHLVVWNVIGVLWRLVHAWDLICVLHVHHRVDRGESSQLILNHFLILRFFTEHLFQKGVDICHQSGVHFITFLCRKWLKADFLPRKIKPGQSNVPFKLKQIDWICKLIILWDEFKLWDLYLLQVFIFL